MAEQTPTAREFADVPGLDMDIRWLLDDGVIRHLGRRKEGGWTLELVGEQGPAMPLELVGDKLTDVVASAWSLASGRLHTGPHITDDGDLEASTRWLRDVLSHPLFAFLRREEMEGGRTLTSLALVYDDGEPEHAVGTTTWRSAFAAAYQILQEESDA
jgi:hypothetical protein